MPNADPINDLWPPVAEVQFVDVEKSRSEVPFVRAAFELMKETSAVTALAAGLMLDSEPPGHDRNGAVLIGHLVRMVKIMRTTIRSVVDDHGSDQHTQLMRQFLDSASVLAYLVEDIKDTTRFDAYVNNSLIAEREFLKTVREQIAQRDGTKLPIEERIERSITTTFEAAGVREEDIPSRKRNGWPSVEQRLKLLTPTAYVAYRTGSSSTHGDWNDLLRNHLEKVDGRYQPQLKQDTPRPQALLSMSILAVALVQTYVDARYPDASPEFTPRLEDLYKRLRRVDDLHEQYLVRLPGHEAV